jgi:hypothetical protein
MENKTKKVLPSSLVKKKTSGDGDVNDTDNNNTKPGTLPVYETSKKTKNKGKKPVSKRMDPLSDKEYREFEKQNAKDIKDAIERVRANQNREYNSVFKSSKNTDNPFLEGYYEDEDEDDNTPRTDSHLLADTSKLQKPTHESIETTKNRHHAEELVTAEAEHDPEIVDKKKPLNLSLLNTDSIFFSKIILFLYNKDYDKFTKLNELNIDFETARDLYNNDDSINLSSVT